MDDCVPAIIEKIHAEFQKRLKDSRTLKEIHEKLDSKKAKYEDVYRGAREIGRILSASLRTSFLVEDLPEGRLYYNIAKRVLYSAFTEAHEETADLCEKIVNQKNAAARIGVKAIRPKLNTDRIDGLIEHLMRLEDEEGRSGQSAE